jgi:hypothetical protein
MRVDEWKKGLNVGQREERLLLYLITDSTKCFYIVCALANSVLKAVSGGHV